jgi:hypothetical protein
VKVLTFTNVLEVTSKGVVVSDKNGNDNTLVADSIVLVLKRWHFHPPYCVKNNCYRRPTYCIIITVTETNPWS